MEILDTTTTVIIVAAITGVIKKASGLPGRFTPLLSMVIGIIVGVFAATMNVTPLLQGAWLGLVAGLMASGAYDVAKRTIKG